MTTELMLDAVEHALFTRAQQGVTDLSGLVAHSDAVNTPPSPSPNGSSTRASTPPWARSGMPTTLAETTVGSFKNELIRRQGPWRDLEHIEIGTLDWVHWFNTERPHEYLDDLTPEAAEQPLYEQTARSTLGPRHAVPLQPNHRPAVTNPRI